jgi:cell division protein FtsA
VITGGGALMEGMQELSERIFEMPVKLGMPFGFGGLTEAARSPVHATGVGLCKYAIQLKGENATYKAFKGDDNFKKILNKMKSWIKEFF